MVRGINDQLNLNLEQIVGAIISSGQLDRQQHLQLASAILTDSKLSQVERRQINLIFDYVQMGRLRVVD